MSVPSSDNPVVLREGALIGWTLRLALRMIVRGVRVGGRGVPRRTVSQAARRAALSWWRWTTALPGDVFYDLRRDIYVEVAAGTPRHRTVRLMAGLSRARGADFASILPETTDYRWHDLEAV